MYIDEKEIIYIFLNLWYSVRDSSTVTQKEDTKLGLRVSLHENVCMSYRDTVYLRKVHGFGNMSL